MISKHTKPLAITYLFMGLWGGMFVAMASECGASGILLGSHRTGGQAVRDLIRVSVSINVKNDTKTPLLVNTSDKNETPFRVKGTYQPPIGESIVIQEDYVSKTDPFVMNVRGMINFQSATCSFTSVGQKNIFNVRFYFINKKLQCGPYLRTKNDAQ